MNIVAADPQARVLSESEVRALLTEPIPMRLGMVDGQGWPLVNPVWHVFEDGVFRIVIGKTSRKARVLRATPRAYFTVDTGSAHGDAQGVRGRADVRLVDGDTRLAVDVARKALLKYTGTDTDAHAEEMLTWARDGQSSVVELTPLRFAAFGY
jgi:Pyridoxamine 5'-phosphate oxidase